MTFEVSSASFFNASTEPVMPRVVSQPGAEVYVSQAFSHCPPPLKLHQPLPRRKIPVFSLSQLASVAPSLPNFERPTSESTHKDDWSDHGQYSIRPEMPRASMPTPIWSDYTSEGCGNPAWSGIEKYASGGYDQSGLLVSSPDGAEIECNGSPTDILGSSPSLSNMPIQDISTPACFALEGNTRKRTVVIACQYWYVGLDIF